MILLTEASPFLDLNKAKKLLIAKKISPRDLGMAALAVMNILGELYSDEIASIQARADKDMDILIKALGPSGEAVPDLIGNMIEEEPDRVNTVSKIIYGVN